MTRTIIAVGNTYIDHNIFGIETGDASILEPNSDYLATGGSQVVGGSSVNVALQLKSLGNKVAVVVKTGQDTSGRYIREFLEETGINTSLLATSDELDTSVSVNMTVNEGGEFTSIRYGRASRDLDPEDVDLDHSLFSQADGVYFGGTVKQARLFDQAEDIFKQLHDRGVKVFYDPNRYSPDEGFLDPEKFYKQLAFVEGYLPNKDELLEVTGLATVNEALDSVLQTGVNFVAVKLGPEGCRVKTSDDDFTIDGHSIDPLTTIGAGDCFNATLISHYLNGYSLRSAAQYAVTASAIKVSRNIWPNGDEIANCDL